MPPSASQLFSAKRQIQGARAPLEEGEEGAPAQAVRMAPPTPLRAALAQRIAAKNWSSLCPGRL